MIYELRIYHMHPGKMDGINARFGNHTLKLFKNHDIKVVDFWLDATGAEKLYYICEFPDQATKEAAWVTFGADPEWKRVYEESHKDGPIVERVESFLMTRAPYFPQ